MPVFDNGKQRFFKPETTFEEGAYVIFDNTTNPLARYVKNLFTSEQSQLNAARNELRDTLIRLAQAERAKECNYLRQKISQMRDEMQIENSADFPIYQKAYEIISNYENGGAPGQLSMLFNILLQGSHELELLMKDSNDVLANSVHSRGFDAYLKNYFKSFEQKLKVGAKSFDANMTQFLGGNKTLGQLFDDYLKETFAIDLSNTTPENKKLLTEFKNSMLNEYKTKGPLAQFFANHVKAKITPQSLERALRTNVNIKKTKDNGKQNTIRTLIDQAVPRFLRGITLEMQIASGQGGAQVKRYHTGSLNQKGDVLIVDQMATVTTGVNFDSNFISAELSNDITNMHRVLKKVHNEIFAMSVSAKDYQSHRNFQIAKPTFANAAAIIKDMSDSTSFTKLLQFYLNNSVDGAMLENQRDEILQNIAYIAAAYMFDDIKEMFISSSSDHQLHLYNINGAYHSLSDLLLRGAEDITHIDPTRLVTVDYRFSNNIIEEEKDAFVSGLYPLTGSLDTEWKDVRSEVSKTILEIHMKREAIKEATETLRQLLKNTVL
jgi:hypothetical protein